MRKSAMTKSAGLVMACMLFSTGVSAASPDEWLGKFDSEGLDRLESGNSPALAAMVDQWQPPMLSKSTDDAGVVLYQKSCRSVAFVGTSKGLGSGSVISAKGLILTNAHVVGDEVDVKIALLARCDGSAKPKMYPAKVIGRDKGRDLAIVRMEKVPAGLPVVKMADLSNVRVGARVFTLGHPKGLVWTLTQGLVSQVRPSYKMKSGKKVAVIQTDAAISPGNSGGPLFLPDGRQIGVNTFGIVGEATSGLNFAVATDEVMAFAKTMARGSEPESRPAPSRDRNSASAVRPVPSSNAGSASARAPQKCKTKHVYEGRDEKLVGNVVVSIVGCGTKPNTRLLVPDDKTRPIVIDYDRNGDSLPDAQLVDSDRDGGIDISFHDNDYDRRFESMGRHPDGKLVPTTQEAIPPVLPLSKSMRDDPIFKSILQ